MNKKSNITDCLKAGTKDELWDKVRTAAIIMFLVYQLGYALGTFLANIGL